MEEVVIVSSILVGVVGEGWNGNAVVTGVRQFNPKCEMLDGFLREECEQNKEYTGFSGVPWFAWLLLGLVLGLILVVVGRMLCASWKGREEEEKRRQKREESRQRKLSRELKKTDEKVNKKSELKGEEITEEDSRMHTEYQVPCYDSEYRGEGESVRGQVAGPSSLLFPTYEQVNEGRAPVPYAEFRNMDRTSVYV